MMGSLSLHSIIKDDNVFDGTNFPDWEMNIRIVLGLERVLYTLDRPIPKEPPRENTIAWESWKTHNDDNITAQCIMLAAMSLEFRRQNKEYNAYQIMARLRDSYKSSLHSKRFEISKKLFSSRMQEGTSVEEHVTDMMTSIDVLASLNIVTDAQLWIDLVLHSLPDSWDDFVMNYVRLNKEKTLGELLQILKMAEPKINKGKKYEAHLHESFRRKKGKCKEKTFHYSPFGFIQKSQRKTPLQQRADHSQDICLSCGEKGHWIRHCTNYKVSIKNEKQSRATISGPSGI